MNNYYPAVQNYPYVYPYDQRAERFGGFGFPFLGGFGGFGGPFYGGFGRPFFGGFGGPFMWGRPFFPFFW